MAKNNATDDALPQNADAQAADGSLEAAPKSKKKLFIIIGAMLVLLLAVGGGLFAMGVIGGGAKNADKAEKAAAENKADAEATFFDPPDMVINISDAGGRQRFLKLSLSLELANKTDEPKLKLIMPRVTDQFQTYLRELKVEDLRGSAGIYRLRQELLSRVRIAAKPVDVRDVLFREILVDRKSVV